MCIPTKAPPPPSPPPPPPKETDRDRDRETERDRDRDRQTDRGRQRQTQRDTETQKDTEREGRRKKTPDRQRKTETDTERQRETHTQRRKKEKKQLPINSVAWGACPSPEKEISRREKSNQLKHQLRTRSEDRRLWTMYVHVPHTMTNGSPVTRSSLTGRRLMEGLQQRDIELPHVTS